MPSPYGVALPFRNEITQNAPWPWSWGVFTGHNNFTMVTIENERWMCYNKIDYTPGGVYVEYY